MNGEVRSESATSPPSTEGVDEVVGSGYTHGRSCPPTGARPQIVGQVKPQLIFVLPGESFRTHLTCLEGDPMITAAATAVRSAAVTLRIRLGRPRVRRSTWTATLADVRRANAPHDSVA